MGVRLACVFLLVTSFAAHPSISRGDEPQPIRIWLDVDTSTGLTDVDDGLTLIQAFHSPEVAIKGVSTVYGNAPLPQATRIARDIVGRFGPENLEVHEGAASAKQLGEENAAVRAMAAELAKGPMTILALGPVTNVGTLVKLHPELHKNIERIICVAARRPGQRFVSSDRQRLPHRDFNFEHDPAAMQILLDSSTPLVYAPWEISSHVWITRDDLESLRRSGGSGAWVAETSQYWIANWEKNITDRGFNPFDTLALGWVTHPELVEAMRVTARIEEGPDDRATADEQSAGKTKPYLVVEPADDAPREIVYCFEPKPEFKAMLLERLAGAK